MVLGLDSQFDKSPSKEEPRSFPLYIRHNAQTDRLGFVNTANYASSDGDKLGYVTNLC